MNENSLNFLSLRDIVRISFRHRWKALPVFCLVFGMAVAAALLWPRTYESDAKLFIRIGRSSFSVDPTVTLGQSVTTSESREREINSILEVLRSRELIENVVAKIGAKEMLGPDRSIKAMLGFSSKDPSPARHREDAVRTLAKSLNCDVSKNSSVISIHCEARSPELAQSILKVFIDAFTDYHLKLNRTSGSHAFFAAQTEQTKKRLDEAEKELRDLKNHVGIGSVEGQAKLIEQQVANLQKELTTMRSAIAASQEKLKSLQEQYPNIEEAATLEATSGSSDKAVDAMREELYRLQIKKSGLLAKLSPTHPHVLAVLEEEAEARRLMSQQEYVTEVTNIRSLTARLDGLTKDLADSQQQLLKLNEDERGVHALQQKVDRLRASYDKYVENRERARIDGELESEHITNVNVAQAPTFVSKPVAPDKALLLVLGMFGAVFLATAITLASEYFDDSLQVVDQVERALEMPVVMTVPESRGCPYIWAVRKEETATEPEPVEVG